MTALALFFALAVVTPVVINAYALRHDRRVSEALALSLMILAIWGATRCLHLALPEPDSKGLNPMFDFIGGLAVLGSWVAYRGAWKLILALLFAAQLLLAAWFWWEWEIFDNSLSYRSYLRLNNVLWLLQLVCVAWPGGFSVARRSLHHLRRFLSRHPGLGASS